METVSITFTAKPLDSLYKISISDIFKRPSIRLVLEKGSGILSFTKSTLFSIKLTTVLLYAESKSLVSSKPKLSCLTYKK